MPNWDGSSVHITIKSIIINEKNYVHSLVTTTLVEQVACEGFGDLDIHDKVNGG